MGAALGFLARLFLGRSLFAPSITKSTYCHSEERSDEESKAFHSYRSADGKDSRPLAAAWGDMECALLLEVYALGEAYSSFSLGRDPSESASVMSCESGD